MSVSLQPNNPVDKDAEWVGHDYCLSNDQYQRTIEAKIIPRGDGVELRHGFLYLKPDPGTSQAVRHYRLSVDQYQEMARLGILTTDDRIELLEGWLVAKMTKYPPHTVSKGLAYDALTMLLPAGWFVAMEDPVIATDSEPEPDLSIVRGTRRDYLERAPSPQQIARIIEVADTSLSRDRSWKKQIYARSGFLNYWIINLVDRRVEVYSEPTGPVKQPDYRHRQDYGPDEMIPVLIAGQEVSRIAVRNLLP